VGAGQHRLDNFRQSPSFRSLQQRIELGLSEKDRVLLALTLSIGVITLGTGRTTVLRGSCTGDFRRVLVLYDRAVAAIDLDQRAISLKGHSLRSLMQTKQETWRTTKQTVKAR
jgi:hypothetical protein